MRPVFYKRDINCAIKLSLGEKSCRLRSCIGIGQRDAGKGEVEKRKRQVLGKKGKPVKGSGPLIKRIRKTCERKSAIREHLERKRAKWNKEEEKVKNRLENSQKG